MPLEISAITASSGTQAITGYEWVNVATCHEAGGKIMSDNIRWSEIFEMEDFRDISVSNDGAVVTFASSEWAYGTAII
jgi:hypothetical protein